MRGYSIYAYVIFEYITEGGKGGLPARQVERLGLVVVQPHEAVADAQDLVLRHAVVRKRKHDILHHVVQPGAQAAAGDDGGGDLLGLKVYPLARPRAHGEGREGDAGAVVRVGHALAARRTCGFAGKPRVGTAGVGVSQIPPPPSHTHSHKLMRGKPCCRAGGAGSAPSLAKAPRHHRD